MTVSALDLEFDDLEFDDLDFAEALTLLPPSPPSPGKGGMQLRDYQIDALKVIEASWAEYSRILAVKATGTGKTVVFSQVTDSEVGRGGRVLILAHTDELLEQAMDKLQRSTGLVAEKEKADCNASPFARVVVGSIQTLSRENRLTGFPDNHFTLVIVDEAHRSLAKSYQKVLCYFHFGRESLAEDWKAPEPGIPYTHKARILGVTATADRGDKRSLGEFYQKCVFDYGLLQACLAGYLVRPITHNIPLQIDLRGVKTSRTGQGSDYDIIEVTQRITPFLREIAKHITAAAIDRKTVVFMPGIETARLLSEALREYGLNASFVSGACPDRKEKLLAFDKAGRGAAICNAMLLTEGWDCPDVSCICVLRPTKIRALYTQCVGRGTRTLPGTIDGLRTAPERLAAIAASAKPNLRILDFLWLSDKLDLVRPVDLVAGNAKVRDRMIKQADGPADVDLLDAAAQAEAAESRDLLASLERAAKEHKHKKGRVVDPLALAVAVGDMALASLAPESRWDELPPTTGQLEHLKNKGIDTEKVHHRGLASKLIDRLSQRQQAGLCSAKQLNFLIQLGVDEHRAALMSFQEAGHVISQRARPRKVAAQLPLS